MAASNALVSFLSGYTNRLTCQVNWNRHFHVTPGTEALGLMKASLQVISSWSKIEQPVLENAKERSQRSSNRSGRANPGAHHVAARRMLREFQRVSEQ